MYTNLFFSHIFYKFLILILNWTAQITGLNWRKLIELLRNLKIKRRMSKKIQLFTVEDSLKSSLCVRQSKRSKENPRGQTFLWELRMTNFDSKLTKRVLEGKCAKRVYMLPSYHLWRSSIVLRKHVVHFNTRRRG